MKDNLLLRSINSFKLLPRMLAGMAISMPLFAAGYTVPPANDILIGQLRYHPVNADEKITAIQQQYNVGFNAIKAANPHIDPTKELPAGATLVIPSQHLLPDQPRKGIVINLPEMRMYYYPEGKGEVLTYPIGIGKIGKTIPITNTAITRKAENPTWVPPQDIREYNLNQGIVLPKVLPPGPDNPLGPYAIYMRVPTYLIHSTIFPESVGKRASFGCIRMYESDIKEFFPSVASGIPVAIINSPVKLGWQQQSLMIEAHPPLEEHNQAIDATLPGMVRMISDTSKNQPVLVDWQAVAFIAKERDGVPHDVGFLIH